MSFLTGIFTSWNVSKKLPEWGVLIGLTLALGYALWGCDKTTITKSTTVTEYRDTGLSNIDSLLALLRARPTKIIHRETIRTIYRDTSGEVSNIAYTEDSTDYPPDSSLIAVVESIRDEIEDYEPLPAFIPSFGYRVDAILGPSLPGGTVIGLHGRAWFDRISIFANPRLVIPDFSRSSVDLGIGYRVF